jgi:hypothetical protein
LALPKLLTATGVSNDKVGEKTRKTETDAIQTGFIKLLFGQQLNCLLNEL